jgi:hypothetical protein
MRQCSSSRHSVALIITIGNWELVIRSLSLGIFSLYLPTLSEVQQARITSAHTSAHLLIPQLPLHGTNLPQVKILVIFYIGTVGQTLKLIL